MIFRLASIFALISLLIENVVAEVAPEITTVSDGYQFIAKVPCSGCPYLSQDTFKGQNEPWTENNNENAKLLNITLPFSSTHLNINTAALLTPSPILPKIYANQIPLSTTIQALSTMLENNSLDTPGSASFALSYAYSLHPIKSSPNALIFHFDILELWSDVTSPPITVVPDAADQKMLELVLLQRPLLSALDTSPTYSIIRTSLIPRTETPTTKMKKMWFHDWDQNGKKGTSSHLFNRAQQSFVDYVNSGVWALFIFIAALMGLFVVLCLFCCFAVGALSGEEYDYEKAQVRKRMRKNGWKAAADDMGRERRGGDVEKGRAVERLVGVGKSD
ncbi:hypothetical protein T440DRAFT_467579 [Plenodomus tracheiphilus IPT5]|uniref:Uncharacterized protein n=1 Tax=Plenodomus tracheiphilus IPT5 TaxID=1408161 RepID=A0A6A7B8D4_9PLEO|nr:hypothetical protein T440DRAFT_467579 [Plenodomus tracheiphilus IPT5]